MPSQKKSASQPPFNDSDWFANDDVVAGNGEKRHRIYPNAPGWGWGTQEKSTVASRKLQLGMSNP